jgi:polysaccharide export outer membrane protein
MSQNKMAQLNFKKVLLISLALLWSFTIHAQSTGFFQVPEVLEVETEVLTAEEQLLLALSNPDYPVTPGDRFELVFRTGGQLVVDQLQVQSDYSLNLNIFGVIDVEGRTFEELKFQVERIVEDSYARSFPALSLVSLGRFQVFIEGNLPRSRYISAWGLTRLSEVLSSSLGPFSSIRDVLITSREGLTRQYDLALALYGSRPDQDPFVKPGDQITIAPAIKIVRISGEVLRPGVYQLQKEENFNRLLEFAGNLSPLAGEQFRLYRQDQGTVTTLRPDAEEDTVLANGDDIIIPSKNENLPVVYIEAPFLEGPGRITHPYRSGESAVEAISTYLVNINPEADLSRARIIRGDQQIQVDLERPGAEQIVLEEFDILAIPENQGFIAVTGAVYIPGQFPYRPAEDVDYYLSLAGGINEEENDNKAFILRSAEGKEKRSGSAIEPGDTIHVQHNDFVYGFNRYVPLAATTVALITSIITLMTTLNM